VRFTALLACREPQPPLWRAFGALATALVSHRDARPTRMPAIRPETS
jgi:hypothetical protein